MKNANVFDFVKSIAEKKKILSAANGCQRYMLSRYLSFMSPSFALVLEDFNRKWSGLTDQMFYTTIFNILPKFRFDSRKYVKKETPPKSNHNMMLVEIMARDLQISKREVLSYLKTNPDLVSLWKKMETAKTLKK